MVLNPIRIRPGVFGLGIAIILLGCVSDDEDKNPQASNECSKAFCLAACLEGECSEMPEWMACDVACTKEGACLCTLSCSKENCSAWCVTSSGSDGGICDLLNCRCSGG